MTYSCSATRHLQAEKVEEGGWNEPPGFHLIPLPFADDIRAAPLEEGFRGDFMVKSLVG
jgi:ATP-dependent DNA helicase 2 subunit 1